MFSVEPMSIHKTGAPQSRAQEINAGLFLTRAYSGRTALVGAVLPDRVYPRTGVGPGSLVRLERG